MLIPVNRNACVVTGQDVLTPRRIYNAALFILSMLAIFCRGWFKQ
jgi:hypothetical protein